MPKRCTGQRGASGVALVARSPVDATPTLVEYQTALFSRTHHTTMGRFRRRHHGQALVESIFTIPLVVFLMLGTMQLFLMMHARILTQLAVFRSNRAGSMNHAQCDRMKHAAILQLIPAIESFMAPGVPGTPAQKFSAAFAKRKDNKYDDYISDGGKTVHATGSIIWMMRQLGGRTVFAGTEDKMFDQGVTAPPATGPTGGGAAPGGAPATLPEAAMRLETRLIFWYPMKIPFANWVMTRMYLATTGLKSYSGQNPLSPPVTANWAKQNDSALEPMMVKELLARSDAGEFVFPIVATSTMRMMTPLKRGNFEGVEDCGTLPGSGAVGGT